MVVNNGVLINWRYTATQQVTAAAASTHTSEFVYACSFTKSPQVVIGANNQVNCYISMNYVTKLVFIWVPSVALNKANLYMCWIAIGF